MKVINSNTDIKFEKDTIRIIHVPKTGSISINKAIRRSGYKIVCGRGDLFHSGIREIPLDLNHYNVMRCRNPYDRLLSAYTYLKNGGKTEGDVIAGNALSDSFEEFVITINQDVASQCHLRPMIYWSGCNLNVYDHVIRFETLVRDWERLRLKFPNFKKLKHKNKTNHDDWRNVYNRDMLDSVNSFYKKDFQVFNYEMV